MKFLIWLVCVIGIEATGIISSLFAGDIAGTYAQMEKPFLAPSWWDHWDRLDDFVCLYGNSIVSVDRSQSQSSA